VTDLGTDAEVIRKTKLVRYVRKLLGLYISVYKSGRLRTLFFDDSFIPLLDLKPLHVSAVL
jgi:hypothetical protein